MSEITKTTVDAKDYGLEESKANKMKEGLVPILSERTILSQQYDEIYLD